MVRLVYTKGEKIGSFVFLREADPLILPSGGKKRVGIFECTCGSEFSSLIDNAKRMVVAGCAICKSKTYSKARTVHGHGMRGKISTEFRIWASMLNRCTNENNSAFKKYGGRGISVCERWTEAFINFLEDMGFKPSKYHSLDRMDNDKGYYKENCRWATKKEQANNRSTTIKIKYKNEIRSVAEWCELLNISYYAVIQRINSGWDCIKALETPIKKKQCQI